MSEHKQSVKELSWESGISIEKAVSLRQELLDGMAGCDSLVVNLSSVETMDLSAIQMLIAAQKEAVIQGKKFHLGGTLQPKVMRQLMLAGFITKEYQNAEDIEAELFSASPERESSDDR